MTTEIAASSRVELGRRNFSASAGILADKGERITGACFRPGAQGGDCRVAGKRGGSAEIGQVFHHRFKFRGGPAVKGW